MTSTTSRTTGPKVVALGGGHGLAVALRATSRYAGDVTAVVSVADDGGSSGRLRAAFGVPAPGDIRHCLTSLSSPDTEWARALDYRFPSGELAGHAMGNLLLVALSETTGSFVTAIEHTAQLLGVTQRVLPATTVPVHLKADIEGAEVVGQVEVMRAPGNISSISLIPPDAEAPEEVVDAILGADQVVLGPGSLFTSTLAVCVVPAIRAALAARSERLMPTVYVCNLNHQKAETMDLDANGHLEALQRHGVSFDLVIADPKAAIGVPTSIPGVQILSTPVARQDGLMHDPTLLSTALAQLVEPFGRTPKS